MAPKIIVRRLNRLLEWLSFISEDIGVDELTGWIITDFLSVNSTSEVRVPGGSDGIQRRYIRRFPSDNSKGEYLAEGWMEIGRGCKDTSIGGLFREILRNYDSMERVQDDVVRSGVERSTLFGMNSK